jgi:hypothetical protein
MKLSRFKMLGSSNAAINMLILSENSCCTNLKIFLCSPLGRTERRAVYLFLVRLPAQKGKLLSYQPVGRVKEIDTSTHFFLDLDFFFLDLMAMVRSVISSSLTAWAGAGAGAGVFGGAWNSF